MPLDPIGRQGEFSAVLKDWIARDPTWRQARGRWLTGLGKDNRYDVNRLIAAANMFDILPADAGPPPETPSAEMLAAKEQCLALLKKLKASPDRDSVIGALGRIGKP